VTDPRIQPNFADQFVRLRDIIAPHGPLPISRSTWFQWAKLGRTPAPIKLGPRVTVYRRADVDAFVADPQGWARARQASRK